MWLLGQFKSIHAAYILYLQVSANLDHLRLHNLEHMKIRADLGEMNKCEWFKNLSQRPMIDEVRETVSRGQRTEMTSSGRKSLQTGWDTGSHATRTHLFISLCV